mmetsp:Transcript_23259/g.59785  ORF Transcript_23259/g.59785 Transcript_23259/m.59785 type:complete len:161 (-) Transcript_23259:293-775(-)
MPAASEPNLEHDSSEDECAATPKFVGSGQRLDGKSSSAKQRKSPASGGGAAADIAGAGSNGAGSNSVEPPAQPKFVGASGTLSGKPVEVEPLLKADPAAEALAGADKFGPALVRTAELRRAAEERAARAAQAKAGQPPKPKAEPGTDDYWASLGSGNKLK